MADSALQKFLAMFLIAVSQMDEWKTVDEETRKAGEEKLMAAWRDWKAVHADAIVDSQACGATKLASANDIADTSNDMVVYMIVEAASHEDAAAMFSNHPHLTIPSATIQIMAIRPIGEM